MDGISMGVNEDYTEVYISFLNGDYKETLVFHEAFNYFTGNNNLYASLYIPFNKTLLMASNASDDDSNIIYQSDRKDGLQLFYEREQPSKLSFIINGNVKEESSAILTKIFESLEILSPHEKLESIEYETELQNSEIGRAHV